MNGMGMVGCCGMGALGAEPWELTGSAACGPGCGPGGSHGCIPVKLMKPYFAKHGHPLGRDVWCGLSEAGRANLRKSLGPAIDPKLLLGGGLAVAALVLLLRK